MFWRLTYLCAFLFSLTLLVLQIVLLFIFCVLLFHNFCFCFFSSCSIMFVVCLFVYTNFHTNIHTYLSLINYPVQIYYLSKIHKRFVDQQNSIKIEKTKQPPPPTPPPPSKKNTKRPSGLDGNLSLISLRLTCQIFLCLYARLHFDF